ncbi:MAG TPA: GNAT family N-acetyltransferase [Nocardioides sp.]|uniref:NUDIX hydrolase n=1 Tax=Nocardioides sp. TaxID=35761 RepID=UPI002E34761F|nr:GNAT family N-acetyltransferase [Nocardioides sp.]HEX3932781.1 GNAT family N-acetyltransferase [Nocardioides sp.]
MSDEPTAAGEPVERDGLELTDGVVTLRPFEESDIAAHVDGEDDEARLWLGQPGPSTRDGMLDVVQRWRREWAAGERHTFAIHHDAVTVGTVAARPEGDQTISLSWLLYSGHRGHGFAARAARLLADFSLAELGARRVQAEVDPRNAASLRVATRAGLHREGVRRVVLGMADRPDATGMVILSRLATDTPTSEPEGFRALLNSFLPRKRAISQLLLRDRAGRVLICRLTYKNDWDLPGGVVEVGESPQLAATREVKEELGLDIEAGPLLLTDWLPPWGGWDDAVCLVFDGGEHDASLTDGIVKQAREIREAEFATPEQVHERCADFTSRRIGSALASLADGAHPAYVESGG